MSTPSRGSKAHNHSKSETPARAASNPSDAISTPARSSQRRPRRNRDSNNHYNQRLPNADPAVVPGYVSEGHNNASTRAYEGSVSDSPVPAAGQKNRRGKQQQRYGNGRVSPPKDPSAATPARDSAYAGPAFHASPAPSALPMPRLFSKSVPANAAPATFQSRFDQESDSSSGSENTESPTNTDATPATEATPAERAPLRDESSPLDLFFKADKAEKARKANAAGASTPPGKAPPQINGRVHGRHASNGVFNMEMDHAIASAPKPASPSPIVSRERLSATRSVTAPSSLPRNNQDSENYPQALKELFHSTKKVQSQSPAPHQGGTPSRRGPDFHTPSPFYNPGSVNPESTNPGSLNKGPVTPANQINLEANPFYYGNRNLSPLFQAARGDSAKRSSNLRQELDVSPSNTGELGYRCSAPVLNTPAQRKLDANTASRNHLDSHIQRSPIPDRLHMPQATGTPPHSGLGSPFHHNSGSPARNDSAQADAKTMENDLKRLLKLQLVDT
ncbi:hypothetical protein JOL62DRAFT_497897 [Phyllosticta paracitricarpa]|uniref:Proteophosphoglycan 5 n=2 Tax=Phyllosticta TaxID=121621 RepID=A0ABR1LN01_9PEZI